MGILQAAEANGLVWFGVARGPGVPADVHRHVGPPRRSAPPPRVLPRPVLRYIAPGVVFTMNKEPRLEALSRGGIHHSLRAKP